MHLGNKKKANLKIKRDQPRKETLQKDEEKYTGLEALLEQGPCSPTSVMLACLLVHGNRGAQSCLCCSPSGSASWTLSALLTSFLGSSSLPGRARDTTNHRLVSFHPLRRKALVLLPPRQGFFYLRGGAPRFLSSLFTGVFASPDFCRYMEG